MIFEIGTVFCLFIMLVALVINAYMWKHQIEANKITLQGFKLIQKQFEDLEKKNEQN